MAGNTPVPMWNCQLGRWEMATGPAPGYMRVVLDSGAVSGIGQVMAWNYEKGCEEPMPYAGGVHGVQSCAPPKFFKRACAEILRWEELEAAWRRDRNWDKAWVMPTVVQAWEEAEMALLGWDKRSQSEIFRRGYIEWLAANDGVTDALSDLEIEQLPMIDRIVARGYRELAKTEHPDVGGTKERFEKLRTAKQQLDRVMGEVSSLLRED